MSERLCCVLNHEGENAIYGLQISVTKLILFVCGLILFKWYFVVKAHT